MTLKPTPACAAVCNLNYMNTVAISTTAYIAVLGTMATIAGFGGVAISAIGVATASATYAVAVIGTGIIQTNCKSLCPKSCQF